MSARDHDDLTIERWRTEPHWSALRFDDPAVAEQSEPLWKDVTLATVVVAALWVMAVLLVS